MKITSHTFYKQPATAAQLQQLIRSQALSTNFLQFELVEKESQISVDMTHTNRHFELMTSKYAPRIK